MNLRAISLMIGAWPAVTFAVSSATELEPAAAAIADGDRGKVRVKGAPGLDATGLQALVAKEVEDETLDG